MTPIGTSNELKPISKSTFVALFLALIAGAMLTRCLNLTHFPMQVHNDEASTVTSGYGLVEKWTFLTVMSGAGFGGHPNFGFWLASLPSQLLGEQSLWTLRLSSGIIGSLSLVFFACFVSHAFGRGTSLLFLLFAAPFHLHVHYSRTGFIYIHSLLLAGLMSWAWALFVTRTSWLSAFLVGITTGFGLLVYPTTQVLPLAMLFAVVCGVMPTTARVRTVWRHPRVLATLLVAFLAGILVSFGPQIFYIYHYGFLSRAGSTFVLQPHNIRHISSVMRDPAASQLEIVWFNVLQTLEFFYYRDSGEQYNFVECPLPWWSIPAAIAGVVVLLWRCLRREPNSLYLVAVAGMTFGASALMVEANFSPHLIMFGLLLPLALALGMVSLVGAMKGSALKRWLGVVVIALVGVMWPRWNWEYYNRVVDPLRPRIFSTETRLVNLPIDTRAVRSLLNTSGYRINFDESTVQLVFPNAKGLTKRLERAPEITSQILSAAEVPSVVLVDVAQADNVESIIKSSEVVARRFDYPQLTISFFYVQRRGV